jgi:hypothetical protein
MLSCGSDAGPLPEGKLGAYEMLRAKFHDAVRAQAAVIEMVKRQRPEAAAYLAEQRFTAEEQSELLARTHCQPPETYLLIGTDLTHKDSWMRMAAWDFRRAYIAAQAKDHPEATVVADARQRFGYSEGEAADLYRQARHTPEEEFIIGPAPRAPSVWYPCQTTPSPGVMRCPLGLMDLNTHNIVDDVVFNSFAPENTVVHYRPAPPGHPPGSPIAQAPAALIVTEGTLRDVPLPEPRFAEMAVLADTKNWRVLVGPAPLIRSTFTHLLFLDGRYAKFFEKIDERTAYNQERLQTWRLNFPQQ